MAKPLKVPDSFDCCPVAVIETFRDYNASFVSNHVLPVLQERLQYEIQINEGTFVSSCMTKYADTYGKPVLDFLKYVRGIQVTIFKEHVNYPTTGQNTYEIYFQQSSFRDTGFSLNWSPNPFSINGFLSVEDFAAQPIKATVDFRVRWEKDIKPQLELAPDNAFPSERVPILGVLEVAYQAALNANFNWSQEEIFIETKLLLNTTNLPFEFDVEQVNRAKMVPFAYEEDVLRGIDSIEFFYLPSTDPVVGTRVCRDLGTSILVKVHKTAVGAFNLIAFFDVAGGLVSSLKEEESYPSGAGFVQLDAVQLDNVDPIFGGGDFAFFELDLSAFTENNINIAAIAKPV